MTTIPTPRFGIEFFRKSSSVKLPERGSLEAVGFDLRAHLLTEKGVPSKRMIPRQNTVAIPTGLVVKPPKGFYVQICSRSGLALRSVFVANAPGIIDPDYTGELMVLLYNGGFETQWIEHDNRIAQMILMPVVPTQLAEMSVAPTNSGRGEAGLGSTGLL